MRTCRKHQTTEASGWRCTPFNTCVHAVQYMYTRRSTNAYMQKIVSNQNINSLQFRQKMDFCSIRFQTVVGWITNIFCFNHDIRLLWRSSMCKCLIWKKWKHRYFCCKCCATFSRRKHQQVFWHYLQHRTIYVLMINISIKTKHRHHAAGP